MKLEILLSIVVCSFNLATYSQANYTVDAYSISISGATATASGFYSLSENQGGMGFSRQTVLAGSYSNRYLLSELATQSLGYMMPAGNGSVGASVSYFGGRALNESSYSLAYGRKLAKWLGAGIRINYHHLSIEAIDNRASAITGEIGIQAFPSEGLCVGIHVKNPTRSRFATLNNDRLFSGIKAGISYSEHEIFNLAAQYNYENFEDGNLAIAGEYLFLKVLVIRAGVKIRYNPSWSFGTGFNFNRLQLDLGFEQHTVLGLSAAVSLIYHIKDDTM